jgi:hypothetical protein
VLAPSIHKPSRRPLAPRIRVSYPKAMTLCIAALADGSTDDPKIVLCSDMQLGDDFHTTQTTMKTDIGFSETLAALYSGAWEDYINLKRVLLRHVRSTSLTLDNYRGVLLGAWKEFDNIPRGAEPTETDAQCLIAGFIEDQPRIIRVQKSGVDSFPFFASIGIGAYHAETIMSWRNIQQYSSLEQVLYFVYEGRRFGELSMHVGGTRITHVIGLDGERKLQADLVMGEGLQVMEGWFKKYGPQEVGYDLKLPEGSIHRLSSGEY